MSIREKVTTLKAKKKRKDRLESCFCSLLQSKESRCECFSSLLIRE